MWGLSVLSISKMEHKMSHSTAPLDSEVLLRALDGARTSIWIWQLDSGDITWSDNVDQVYDFEAGTFPRSAESYARLVHPEDRGIVEESVRQALRGETSHGSRYRLVHPHSGRVFWVEGRGRGLRDDQGEIVTLTGMVTDVTEQQATQEALRISEAKYAAAFLSSPDAIVIAHVADRKIVEVNEGFTRISGFSRDEALGKNGDELGMWSHPDDRNQLLHVLEHKGPVHNQEWSFIDRHGTSRDCLFSASIISIHGEQHLLLVIRDISERKQAEREREGLMQQLRNKADELERFAYTVSHDLKSPLVTIRGFIGLLKKDLERQQPERVERDLERIRRSAQTMQNMLDDLLELSRAGKSHSTFEPVSLRKLVDEALERVGGRIHQAGVEVHVADDLPRVLGDPGQLLQLLQNLVDNAVKFMGDQAHPRIDIGTRQEDRRTVCFVRDNGIGIRADQHPCIFDLFQRLHPEIDGTGIGLALVKRIVEAHGGTIRVESKGEGQGSTFLFSIPETPPEN